MYGKVDRRREDWGKSGNPIESHGIPWKDME